LNERRKLNNEDPSGTGFDDSKINRRKPLSFYEAMQFIAPFIRSRVYVLIEYSYSSMNVYTLR
jgi:hypothetical protein